MTPLPYNIVAYDKPLSKTIGLSPVGTGGFDCNSFHSKYFGIGRILLFHLSISGSTKPFILSYGNLNLVLHWEACPGNSLLRVRITAPLPYPRSQPCSFRSLLSLLHFVFFRSEIDKTSFHLSGSKMKIVNCQQNVGNGANIETD